MVKEAYPIRFGSRDPLVVGNVTFKSSYYISDLTEKEMEVARTELGETEEKKQKCLQELRNRFSKKGRYRTDDAFLLRFLRVRKFDCEKAYQNIKNFYNKRNKNPEVFGTPEDLKSYKKFKFTTILPYSSEEGRIVFWVDLEHWDPTTTPYEEFVQPVTAVGDIAILNPKSQVNGVIGVWDMKAMNVWHVSEFLKKNRLLTLISIAHFTYPWRIKKIILVNTGNLARFLYSIVRPLLSRKISERVLLLGSDLSELHQHVNPAILPKKLGGELEDDACRNPDYIIDNIPYLEYDRSFTGE